MEIISDMPPRKKGNKPYRGVRMRKWGRWVAEVREPNKRSRLWLGSYSTPMAAARAYDTAVYYLRGPTQAKLNFPNEVFPVSFPLKDLSAASVRKVALEVGTRVDAQLASSSGAAAISRHHWVHEIDLNKMPEPEEGNMEMIMW